MYANPDFCHGADVFVIPDTITYYVFLLAVVPLLSPPSGKSNVVQRGHVRRNNGSKILNEE